MTTYNVKIFGRTYRYDLAPIDIINNVCAGEGFVLERAVFQLYPGHARRLAGPEDGDGVFPHFGDPRPGLHPGP